MTTQIPELHFVAGLPGFPAARRFALVAWGPADSPYSLLTSLDHDGVRFLVAPPQCFFPEYEIEVDDATAAMVHLTDPADALVLVIVSVGDRPDSATANLLGPLVVNLRTREGVQAVLPGSGYGTRVPLQAA